MHRWFHKIMAFALLSLLAGCSSMDMYQNLSASQVSKAGMTEHTLHLPQGGYLHYWDRGKGEPVLFIHGLRGDAMMNWKEQMLSFDDQYRVIAPDLLWFGESHSPDSQKNLRSQAEAIVELMDHLDVPSVHIVGHSYGGFVAFKLLDIHPERVNSIAVIANPGPILQDKELDALIERFDADSLETLFVPESTAGLRTLNQGVHQNPKPVPEFIYRDIYRTFFEPNKKAQRKLIETLPDEREKVDISQKRCDVPFFLVWGANDRIFPLQTGIELSRYLNAPIAVLPDAAHAIPSEHGEVLQTILESWLFSLNDENNRFGPYCCSKEKEQQASLVNPEDD